MNATNEEKKLLKEEAARNTEFYYAQYKGDKADMRAFITIEGRLFYIRKEYCEYYVDDDDIGKCFWLMKNGTYTAIARPHHTKQEAAVFKRDHAVGDIICCPFLQRVNDEYRVSISPSLYGLIDKSDAGIALDELIPGTVYQYRIDSMDTTGKHLNIILHLIGACSRKENRIYQVIPEPEAVKKTVIVTKEQAELLSDKSRIPVNTFEKKIGKDNLSQEDYRKYILDQYEKLYNKHQLIVHQGKKGTQIDVDLDVKDVNGVPLKAGINAKNEAPDIYYLALIGSVDPGSEMERYVYIPDFSRMTKQLSDIAIDEDWEGGEDEEQLEPRHILAQYIRFTFYKCMLDGLLEVNEQGNAIFNTGLVNNLYDDIYCYLKINTNINDALKRKWIFSGFACIGSDGIGKEISAGFNRYPEPPKYISPDHPEGIIFDTSKSIYLDYDHIIDDNIDRFPPEYLEKTFMNIPEIADVIKTKDEYFNQRIYRKRLNAAILQDQTGIIRGRIKMDLENAVKLAVKSCRWDYKTAVPVYYARINQTTLLLPLRLDPFSQKTDLALVVQQLQNGNYQGQTILTTGMAYLDARLICKPGNQWLTQK